MVHVAKRKFSDTTKSICLLPEDKIHACDQEKLSMETEIIMSDPSEIDPYHKGCRIIVPMGLSVRGKNGHNIVTND